MTVSATFSNWKDRLTYLIAEAQFLVGGALVSVAIAVIWFRPSIPGVPPIAMGWVATFLLLGPPVFGFFVWGVKKIRTRDMVEVHHVNAVNDVVEKYYVEPGYWKEKEIDGPSPYPINGGTAWAVQEFDHDEELDSLRVKGVWLEETADTKLLTKKSHMRAIYGKLTESHIALSIIRDSVSEFGADIQTKLVNSMAEAREKGKMMEADATKDVFESFKDDAEGHGPDDLPMVDVEEEPAEDSSDGHGPAETVGEATATDGGTGE
jgi:hypothetical protein